MEYHKLMGQGPPGTIRCRYLHKDLENVNMDLFLNVQKWLRIHGKTARPKLTDTQKLQLKTCFDLMDADGSGAIDADELQDAFELLGMNLKRHEIQALLDDVDRDGSGECEYPEFVEIMTTSLNNLRADKEKDGDEGPQVSFDLMATAYRRKRLMEGLMSGDREVQSQIMSMAAAAQEARTKPTPSAETDTDKHLDATEGKYARLSPDLRARLQQLNIGGSAREPIFGKREERMQSTMLPVRMRRMPVHDVIDSARGAEALAPAALRRFYKPGRLLEEEVGPVQYGFRHLKGKMTLPGLPQRLQKPGHLILPSRPSLESSRSSSTVSDSANVRLPPKPQRKMPSDVQGTAVAPQSAARRR